MKDRIILYLCFFLGHKINQAIAGKFKKLEPNIQCQRCGYTWFRRKL